MATSYVEILSSSESSDSEREQLPSVANSLKQTRVIKVTSGNNFKNIERETPVSPRESKRRKVEADKKQKTEDRERKKAEQYNEKQLHKAIHKAEMASRKESQPAERVKQMIVLLETSLTENAELMASLLTQLQELSIVYKVQAMSPSCAVKWKRKNIIRALNEAQSDIVENVQEIDEPHLLVFVSGKEFTELILASKQAQQGQLPASQTLLQFTQILLNQNPSTKLTLAVNNLEAALRAQKTQRNRQFRAAVRNNITVPDISGIVEVTRIDCEEFIVDLQIVTGCCVYLCSTVDCMVSLIVTQTKALADLPFKKENLFSFYDDLGPSVSRKNLQRSGDKVKLIWEHQLMQFPGVSNTIASTISSNFPSPVHLLKAYNGCNTTEQAEQLLSDIEIRRGAGIVATSRRVGNALSKRIHLVMTYKDSTAMLT